MSAVAITGIGIVCALGNDRATVSAAAKQGTRPFAPMRRFDASEFRVNLAAEVNNLDIAGRFGRATLRHESRADHFAMWAAADALEQAGLQKAETREAALFVGASTGGMLEMENIRANHESPEPHLWGHWRFPVWAAAPALQRTLRIGGPAATYMTACSSAAHALGMAMRRVRSGVHQFAVAGGTESVARLTLAGFGSLGVLDPKGTRPFDLHRAGITLGEGAAFFVLESLDSAMRRGKPPLAIISGYGSSSDAHHMVHPREDGGGALFAMQRALKDAGRAASEVEYVNAHGTGTQPNDAMESIALQSLLGDRAVPISSSKSMLGHTLGACGGLEAAITVLGMVDGFVPPNPGVQHPHEIGSLQLVGTALPTAPQLALSSSFAFGGNNVSLVLEQPPQEHASRTARRTTERTAVITGAAVATDGTLAVGPKELGALLSGARPEATLDPAEILGKRFVRRMDPLSQKAAALLAVAAQEASLEPHAKMGLAFGTAFGAFDATIHFLERLFIKGAKLVNPLEFPNLVHNAPAGYAALKFGAQGHNLTSCQEEVCGEEALLSMCELIADETLDQALCGGGDLASVWLDEGYARVDAIYGTQSKHSTVLGGLVLESEPACRKRGAKPWAAVSGFSSVGPGLNLGVAIERALGKSGLTSIARWYLGATEKLTEAIERTVDLPALQNAERVHIRRTLGDCAGAGIAAVATAAAAIASGECENVLVTSATRHATGYAFVLSRCG